MSERWGRFVAYLTAGEDAVALALVRMICAGTVAVHVSRFLYSGAPELALLHHDHGGLSVTHGWFEAWGGVTLTQANVLLVVCALAATLATVGLFTRPAVILTYLSYRAVSGLNLSARGSYDSLLLDILFVLMFAASGRALSVDARVHGDRGPAARWPRLLLVVQLALLYFGSGLSKGSSSWVPGGDASALWYILQQPTWARFPGLPLWTYPLTQIATTVTWVFEMSGLLFLFAWVLTETEPTRPWLRRAKALFARVRFVEVYLLVGLLLHVGIELTMEVGPFSFASLALYPAALGPRRLRAIGDRLLRHRPPRSATA